MTDEPQRIGLREARAKLPTLVQEVADGATFIVTVRGVERCALVPLTELPKKSPKKRRQ